MLLSENTQTASDARCFFLVAKASLAKHQTQKHEAAFFDQKRQRQ